MSTVKQYEVPALTDLHNAPEVAYKNDKLQLLLHYDPPAAWVKTHKYVKVEMSNGQKVNLKYLPVDKVRTLLTRIFQQWRFEIKTVQQIFNSVCVVGTLHYYWPITGEWLTQDGVGAVGVQTDAGAAASNLNAIKADAVMKAAPAAASYALKNAAEKIGNLFGASLGHDDFAAFKSTYSETMPEANDASKTNYQPGPVTQQDIHDNNANYTPPPYAQQVATNDDFAM